MKFCKDGYDYVSECGNYEIGRCFDLWAVWFKGEIVYLTERMKDAKEYCEKHATGKEVAHAYVL